MNQEEDPLEKEMTTHSRILAWKIPWTEEPDRLQFMGSQRVRHDRACTDDDDQVSHSFKKIICFLLETLSSLGSHDTDSPSFPSDHSSSSA